MDLQAQQGLMTTYREAWRTRGPSAWILSALLVGFYCILYWTDLFEAPAAAVGPSMLGVALRRDAAVADVVHGSKSRPTATPG